MSNSNKPVGYECRHVTYCKSRDSSDDLLVVKEYEHYADGSRVPNVRLVKNYKRDFWVTKESCRTHTDKLEWDDLTNLQQYSTTQAQMPYAVMRALGKTSTNTAIRHLAKSPYLYGCDIPTTSLLKKQYTDKYPDYISPKASVASLDIETDVVNGTEKIIMVGMTFKDKVIISVVEGFMEGMSDPVGKIKNKFDELLMEYKTNRNITLDVSICKRPGECVKAVLDKAHEWKPDIITIWNINFDLPRLEKALIEDGFNCAEVFSDPSVPDEYKFFKYIEGPSTKVTQDGSIMTLHWADRWHVASHPASFYFIDAGCVYKRLRVAAGMEPSYALDDIMKTHLNLGKLKFKETDHLSKLAWHVEMQKNYKLEYAIYNIFDCIGLELLDEKTGDVAMAFPVLCGVSDYDKFPRNPKRIVEDMHFFCLSQGKAIATVSDDMSSPLDKYVIGMKEWIVTLPAYMASSDGLNVIKEMPSVSSKIYAHLSDLDIAGTYPTLEDLCNISKETTVGELSKIKGISEPQQREIGILLNGGVSNAIEICSMVFKFPSPIALLDEFMCNSQ